MKIRVMILLGATLIAHQQAYASSPDALSESDGFEQRRVQSNYTIKLEEYDSDEYESDDDVLGGAAYFEKCEQSTSQVNQPVGYLDPLIFTLRVQDIPQAFITITGSDPGNKLVKVAARDLPPYKPFPKDPRAPNICQRAPDLTGYEDLNGKKFVVDPLVPYEEGAELGCTEDTPMVLMIPDRESGFSLKVEAEANGYQSKTEYLTIPTMKQMILIQGLPKSKEIKIQGKNN